ncbi:MAG: response regulator [Deltaproteobacteria bacterium]|nr:response regulator [Deltaproteobacteria bacterium]MBT4265326.1 response regulator [Deltaproteobacteria bacterium]MBT4643986.1 response regulator [Deltaproteobacteria bacterium]MBT6615003.1 response regulator [Deltaproteobacteria bacterium]
MSLRVLLVDDEKDFVETLAERLEVRNFTVLTALSGDEAIEKVKKYHIDIIVMDLLMPGKSGIETYKEIRMIHPAVGVIMLTGHAELETAMAGLKLGIYDYLIKPVQIEELVEKLKMAHSHKVVFEERKSRK